MREGPPQVSVWHVCVCFPMIILPSFKWHLFDRLPLSRAACFISPSPNVSFMFVFCAPHCCCIEEGGHLGTITPSFLLGQHRSKDISEVLCDCLVWCRRLCLFAFCYWWHVIDLPDFLCNAPMEPGVTFDTQLAAVRAINFQ